MRKLDQSAITNTIAMPHKAGILDHLQAAYQEAIAELGKCVTGVYDAAQVYILTGCVNTGIWPNYNISSGSVFCNGEVFLVDAASFTLTGANVAVGTLITTYLTGLNADPVAFTDGVSRSIHQIRKVMYGPALSGSGLGDYQNAVDLRYRPQGGIGQIVSWRMPGNGTQDSLLPTYFNNTGLGIHPLCAGWAIANGANGTDNDSGLFEAGLNPLDANFNSIGKTGGGSTTLDITNMPAHQHKSGSEALYNDFGGGNIVGTDRDYLSGPNYNHPSYKGANTSWVGGSGGSDTSAGIAQPFKVIPPYITRLKIQRIA
jgi:hypothetical protein